MSEHWFYTDRNSFVQGCLFAGSEQMTARNVVDVDDNDNDGNVAAANVDADAGNDV